VSGAIRGFQARSDDGSLVSRDPKMRSCAGCNGLECISHAHCGHRIRLRELKTICHAEGRWCPRDLGNFAVHQTRVRCKSEKLGSEEDCFENEICEQTRVLKGMGRDGPVPSPL